MTIIIIYATITINNVLPSLVFRMVEAEEEYTEQLEILISCFLRPFKVNT